MTTPLLLGSFKRHLIGTGVAVVGWVAFSYLPKTAVGVMAAKKYSERALPYFREIMYEPATLALVDEVVANINSHQDKPVKRNGIDFYQTNALFLSDVRHLGSSSTGALIWLPIGTRPNAEDVFHYHCTIENSVDMAEFCLLSQAAKKFLIAREIYFCEDGFPLVRCLIGLALIGVGSIFHYSLNSLLDMKKQLKLMEIQKEGSAVTLERLRQVYTRLSRNGRRTSIFTLGLLGIPVYYLLIASYSAYKELKIHEKLADLGPEYVRGGKEFYEKVITCNKYAFVVFGEKTMALSSGDFDQGRFSLFHKSLPLTEKMQFFHELDKRMNLSAET